jgi:hypothetical protein
MVNLLVNRPRHRQDEPMRRHRQDPSVGTIVDRYVTSDRRYLNLLHGNVLHMMDHKERVSFGHALAGDAAQITDGELEQLLAHEWRSQLTAAWLVGFALRDSHRDRIGELLLASRVSYAGQGFCFALARFGTRQDAQLLIDYLDRYLPRLDLFYDQHWAMGALLHLDEWLGTDHANRFLDDGGAWHRWVDATAPQHADPDSQRRHIDELCSFADDSNRSVDTPDTPE